MIKATLTGQSNLRELIKKYYLIDESFCVEEILEYLRSEPLDQSKVKAKALQISQHFKEQRQNAEGIESLLNKYDLSSDEGIALMCLAEALLRIPDKENIDRFINDKITSVNWELDLNKNNNTLVNAASLGLSLAEKIVKKSSGGYLSSIFKSVTKKTTKPLIRKAILEIMEQISNQYIVSEHIDDAIENSIKHSDKSFKYSYDMLGEEALTMSDADRFYNNYKNAIEVIGRKSLSDNIWDNPSISVKLSAIYPRYEWLKKDKVISCTTPKLIELITLAKKYNIAITIDAEEASRLDLSLDLFEKILSSNALDNYKGFGVAVQAYQKRAISVIEWLSDTAKQYNRKISVRLVKGAYWDSEIKQYQVDGAESYPVFTRKVSTDLSYIACVKKLFGLRNIYPQYATHNPYSIAYILETYKNTSNEFEFQCLFGMGDSLYKGLFADKEGINCRIYAPVGEYIHLLPYLVRRLLENGANSSFINQINNADNLEKIIVDPIEILNKRTSYPHSKIPLPKNIFGKLRYNSSGIDLSHDLEITPLLEEINKVNLDKAFNYTLRKDIAKISKLNPVTKKIFAPHNSDLRVGKYQLASIEYLQESIVLANNGYKAWEEISVVKRAEILDKASELFWKHRAKIMCLLIKEAGKTITDAINELRETIDFCRYYALVAKRDLLDEELIGPTGESNILRYCARGVIACISPWNFPLAIFVGQVVAALVCGNAVVAKPASQTPLIACFVVDLLHKAGVPKDVLHIVTGSAKDIGEELSTNSHIKGVMLTGSTETAKKINLNLANRPGEIIPFVAETGGQNAMIVDSTALPEQVVRDVVSSAFYSAGQRCSALRVLYIQEEVFSTTVEMLSGAMAELDIGDPINLSVDIGPVIDNNAKQNLEEHIKYLDNNAKLIFKHEIPTDINKNASFVTPCAYEINSILELKQEHFGPILHVVKYKICDLDKVIDEINSTGFGLTFGVHSRINSTIEYITSKINVGNIYINRNIIGAVVGVQPFGGEGLSGTGPKAGGPNYLKRLTTERTICNNIVAIGGNPELLRLED